MIPSCGCQWQTGTARLSPALGPDCRVGPSFLALWLLSFEMRKLLRPSQGYANSHFLCCTLMTGEKPKWFSSSPSHSTFDPRCVAASSHQPAAILQGLSLQETPAGHCPIPFSSKAVCLQKASQPQDCPFTLRWQSQGQASGTLGASVLSLRIPQPGPSQSYGNSITWTRWIQSMATGDQFNLQLVGFPKRLFLVLPGTSPMLNLPRGSE